ncbi:MAG: right-handed parallel beta-helix repeat-containing protein [Candidatus Acidiferrum sp.]|jgi:parallel beta-helix repeat protein
MNICSKLTISVFLLLIGCTEAFTGPRSTVSAKTYYISSTSGNDADDGLSPQRAWQHLSKIGLKSTSAEPFQPGDNILLKRGDQWDGQIRLQANGTEQKPVTIGAFGQGPKPLLYGDNPQIHWDAVADHLGIYTADMGRGSVLGSIFLEGKTVRAIYPGGSLNRSEYLEAFIAELQSGTLAGQYEGRLWVRTHEGETPNGKIRVFRSAGVMLANSSYVRIENLDIERFYTGIDITNSHDMLVDHNDIQDVLGIGIYLRSGDVNCRVESNTVFRGGNTALYVLKGSNNTFRDNWVSRVENKILGIQVGGDAMGVGLQESKHSLVEYNYFARSGGMDFYYEQDSIVRYNFLDRVRSAGAPHGVNLSLYGNIYNLGGVAGARGSTGINAGITGPGIIVVFNNTIFNAYAYSLMGSSDKGGKIVFSDNIVSSAVAGSAMTLFGANVVSTHNCFYAPGEPVFSYSKAKFPSLKSYQAQSGLDSDSIFADPQFLSAMPVTPLGFQPSSTSGCNSPASNVALADAANGRTFDHDREVAGSPIIGALRVDQPSRPTSPPLQSCKSDCLKRTFTVPVGVYLVRVRFVSAVLDHKQDVSLVLNGRRVAAEFDSSAPAGPDALLRYFLVRPDGNSIALATDANTDISVVSDVDVIAFDARHGDGTQVIPW